MVSALKYFLLSSAVFFKEKLEQLGDDLAPNRWTSIWWSSGFFEKSPPGHQRNERACVSWGETLTWWNIFSISAEIPIRSWRKRSRTPTRLLVKSGPWSSSSFSDVFRNLAAQSKTTLTLSGFWGWTTGWWGRYHTGLPTWPSGIFCAWPREMYSSTVSLYFLLRSTSFSRRLFRRSSLFTAMALLFGRLGFSYFQGRESW